MTTRRRLDTNVPGPFYVNTACIDCDTCRQLAPEVFTDIRGYSAVTRQPEGKEEERKAFRALLACPTGAIGSECREGLDDAMNDFPLLLADGIYYCGFTSAKSYGGSSYFVAHPDGNWLIDSPRFHPKLVGAFERMGGIGTIFLTHRDDVADAAMYAERFSAQRIINELEKSAQPGAEHVISGLEPVEWHPDFKIIPTPGHTRGHMALLYRKKFLFTGDHLAWDRDRRELTAHDEHCWYSWDEQIESMKRLAAERFEWILPGHGERIHLPFEEMRQAMNRLIERMKLISSR